MVRNDGKLKRLISGKHLAAKYAVIALVVMIAAVLAVQLIPGGTENSSAADGIAIDLSNPTDVAGAVWDGMNAITFDTGANSNTYNITQSGDTLVTSIIFLTGVSTTVTIDGIDITGQIVLDGTADVTLLLEKDNTVTGNIIVPYDAAVTIDSVASCGSCVGSLTVAPNSALNNGLAGIGGDGTVVINGGAVTAAGGVAGICGSDITIGSAASIKAYSEGGSPIVCAESFTDSGYFVDASLAAGMTGKSTLGVYLGDKEVTELNLPAGYRNFAFQDPATSLASEEYNIYLMDSTGGRMPIEVVREADESPAIFSVNSLGGYVGLLGAGGLGVEMTTPYTDVNGEQKSHEATVLMQDDLDASAVLITPELPDTPYYSYVLDDLGPGGGWFVLGEDITVPDTVGGVPTQFSIDGNVEIIIPNGISMNVECTNGIEDTDGNFGVYSQWQPGDSSAMGILTVPNYAIVVDGDGKTFTNTADILSSIDMNGTSSMIINGVTGTITSDPNQTSVVLASNGEILNNYGNIIGDANGVRIGANGTINNFAAPYFYPGDDTLYGDFPSDYRGMIQGNNLTSTGGVVAAAGGTVNNYGDIQGNGASSQQCSGISSGGNVDITINNYAGAVITGVRYGIDLPVGGATITNYGEISGRGTLLIMAGIYSAAGSIIVNNAGATIIGARNGIYIADGISIIDNYGLIAGTAANGQGIHASNDEGSPAVSTAVITNHAPDPTGDPVGVSTIRGTAFGVNFDDTIGSEIHNFGIITSAGDGINCQDNEVVVENTNEVVGNVVLGGAAYEVVIAIGSYIDGNLDMSASEVPSLLLFEGTAADPKLDPNDMTFCVITGDLDIGAGPAMVYFDMGTIPSGHEGDRVYLIDGGGTASGVPAPPLEEDHYRISIISSDGDLVADNMYPIIYYDLNGGNEGSAPAFQIARNGTNTLSTVKPTHDPDDGSDVLFIGWCMTKVGTIIDAGGAVPARVTSIVVKDVNVTVYALWGYDRNGNGIPDAVEGPPTGPSNLIIATSDSNSSISPSGTVSVPSGGSRTFSFSADTGYHISAVTVDGIDLSQTDIEKGSYTFFNVVSGHTISVSSAAGEKAGMTLTINIVAGSGSAEYSINGGGFLTYSTPVPLPDNADVTVRAVADDGYSFSGWGYAGGMYKSSDYSLYGLTTSVSLDLHFAGGQSGNNNLLWWVLIVIVILIIIGFLIWFFLFYRRKYEVIKGPTITGDDWAYRKSEYRFKAEGTGTVSYRIGEDGGWKTVLPGPDREYVIPRGEITDKVMIEQR